MNDFWSFQAKDIVNILILLVTGFAVYFSPIRAVIIARREEEKAAKLRQKSEIFASLMKTRRFQLDPEHVAALNLIQVFFSDDEPVLHAYRDYIRLLSRRFHPGMVDQTFLKERDDAFIELVSKIAKALGYQQDKKELEELAYSPEGWASDNATVRKLHSLMIDMFEHKRALPITPIIMPPTHNPFPPPPKQES